MSKRKTHKQTRHLQGEVKRLQAENKRLKKSKDIDKDEMDYDEEGNIVEPNMQPCSFCDTGLMIEIEVVGKKFWRCSLCERMKRA